MNCTHCHTELSDGASFCPQCGNPMTGKPIFPPDAPNPPPQSQHSFLIAFACVLGAMLMIAMFAGVSAVGLFGIKRGDECCPGSVSPRAGEAFNLYGKTIQDEDFDWESLRGKYVLVKFTATWCGPCQGEIPGMLEVYEKYHDKGLEIVSVYIWEQEPNAVATVKNYTEGKRLPWIILSESLTAASGQEPQGKAFGIEGVPTMILVDPEGKIITDRARGDILKRELKKLFEE